MTTDKCSQLAEQIVDYADGELTGDECRRVELHLTRCAPCRALAERLDQSLELATAAWNGAVNQTVADDHQRMTHVRPDNTPHRNRLAITAGTLAVLVVAATILLVAVLRTTPPPMQPAGQRQQVAGTTRPSQPDPESDLPEEFDVERMLRERQQAARRTAAARIIEEITASTDVESQAREYLSEYQTGTASVRLN